MLPSALSNIRVKPKIKEPEEIIYDQIEEETMETYTAEPQQEQPTETQAYETLEEMIDLDFVKKPPIVEEEIFAEVPPKKQRGKPTRSTSPKKTKRKQLSELDKEKRREALARGRETRARNLAKKKALARQQLDLEHEEQEIQLENKQLDLELENQKLNKRTKKVKQVILQDSSSEEEIQYVKKSTMKARHRSPPPPQRSSITAEDVERAQLNTLLAYEKIRKDRKEEKKRVKAIEQEQQQIKQTINQVNNANPQWGRHRHAGKYGGLLQNMGL